MQSSQPPVLTTVLIYVVVLGLFIFRMARPQRMSIARLWIMPFFLVAVTALALWGNSVAAKQLGAAAAAPLQIALALIAGALLGIPLGLFRGRHSEVRATDKPGVMYIHSSPLIVVVWLAAFALRALVRYIMPHAGASASLAGDGVLAFAVSALITSYVIIYQRYRALPPAAAPGASA